MVGRKTGGRVVGTPNRKTRDAEELLALLDCDPIRGMAEIARNPEASLELRGRTYSDLSQLGLMYSQGQGVPQDDKEAVRWCRLAADQGYAAAQSNLGVMYSLTISFAKANDGLPDVSGVGESGVVTQ
jgi:TPR repeat protein